ncbi:MAG: selenide, water dikinase SelD [Chloroflexota bacterium]
MAPGELSRLLQPIQTLFPAGQHPQVLVGLERADDAGVYQLNENQAIISTTDFFPPVVDDPYDFGAIAAANALSDIYAMGGTVLFALNLVAFPDNLDTSILQEILRGGADKVSEAGGSIIGGHSVADKEPKYGLAVTGLIEPEKVKRKGGARPGDHLYLTKPLGVGIVTTALKRGITAESDVAEAVDSMKRLNAKAAKAALAAQAHAMTDITGFGLLGHSFEMARAGEVLFQFDHTQLPLLNGALGYTEKGAVPGGTHRNKAHFAKHVTFGDGVPELIQTRLWTPETSGGLLIAVDPADSDTLIASDPTATYVGSVLAGTAGISVI